jgi:dTDP-4-dehydrorhamnose reductase
VVVEAVEGEIRNREQRVLDREEMKIVLTGAGGMLGTDLVPLLEKDHQVEAFDHKGFDITDRKNVSDILSSLKPDLLINCAAYTKVDLAEEEREDAFKVNGLAVHNLAMSCSHLKIQLCHISTDYVFDGKSSRPYTPFDNTSPVNAYGESKLAGEKYIQWIMNEFYIIRTSWLYGLKGNNFVKSILKLSREKDELRVVSDQIGSPTWTVTLSKGIKQIIESSVFGIHHITDRTEGGISWFDFTKEIMIQSNAPVKVIPVVSEEYPTLAKRPTYAVLDMFHTCISTGFEAPDWKSSLKEYIHTLKSHTEVASS